MALLDTSIIESALTGMDEHYDAKRPDLTKLPATVDRQRYFVKDAIAASCEPSRGPLVGGLSSKSVNDCRLSAGQKVKVRVPNNVGITGGYCEGAHDDRIICWGRDDVMPYRKTGKVGGKNARKRAMRRAAA